MPIKIDATSNGEFRPIPLSRTARAANALAAEQLAQNADRLGLDRRSFLQSLCGAATTLLTLDQAYAASGNDGGRFVLPTAAAFEPAAAAELAGDEFIFDVQTHMVDVAGAWRTEAGAAWAEILERFPQAACGEADPVDCFAAEKFIQEVFLDSDTEMAVLSFVPALPEDNPLTLEEAERTRRLVEQLDGAERLLLHAMVIPNGAPRIDPLALMAEAAARYPIAAWKCYTQWGPAGTGFALDDPATGIPFIEQAKALGIRRICIHKGLLFGGYAPEFGRCADIGRIARRYPEIDFIVYHSGFEAGRAERAYDPDRAEHGIDVLIRSLQDHGIGPNQNVHAELGSTWRYVMRDPTTAAHLLGKLLTHVGQDNVLWGTDSIWYGSPQDQIQAFRAFQIAEPLLEQHGYPVLTPALKQKIFGLNGARVYGIDPPARRKKAAADPIARRRQAYLAAPQPSFQTYGPKTDREFEALLAERGGLPA